MGKPRKGRDFTIVKVDASQIGDPGWADNLIPGRGGKPKGNLANAALPMRSAPEFAGAFAYDEFRLEIMVVRALPWDSETSFRPRPWNDLDCLKVTEWLHHHDIDTSTTDAHNAVALVAGDAAFHPVRDYLAGLQWDQTPRVDRWLSTYLGAPDNEYTSAVGRRFLIGCVARVMRPGCKLDTMPIFEGAQGIGKSTTLRTLGGEWFTDEISDLGSKDAAMQMRGVWLIEMPELDALSTKEASSIKAFLSRTNDRYRPPYGRTVVEVARQCAFAGSTNVEAYLKDATGGRRFWPVRAARCDVIRLDRDRDQLWAEAFRLFQAGEKWWLDTPQLEAIAFDEQDQRYVGDPWTEKIEAFIATRTGVSMTEILCECLFIDTQRQTRSEQMRVSNVLTSLGWKRRLERIGARRAWRYIPPAE